MNGHGPTSILISRLLDNNTLIINTNYDEEILNEIMPQKMKVDINLKNISVYLIDADKIAAENGLKGKINTIMQTALFKVSKLLPFDVAYEGIKKTIEKAYSKKGCGAVESNLKVFDVSYVTYLGDLKGNPGMYGMNKHLSL